MQQQPLYLKYRPQKLSELINQDTLVTVLSNAIQINKIPHACLLTGPRGCGKTSTARIIAKSINCKQGTSTNPCGECLNCKEISNCISPDVIEIDAASHRGIEDAKQIVEKCNFPPQNSPYKVYILDEVHMLSREAFNALLKIIEEPPPQVIFIFATTEEHKILPTIVSRCQRFLVRPIDNANQVKYLETITKKENINIDTSALQKIAQLSKGGMRDALSLLDQVSVLSTSEQTITEDNVITLFGGVSESLLDSLLQSLIQSNLSDSLQHLNTALETGKEPIQILRNLNEYAVRLIETQIINKSPYEEIAQLLDITNHLFEFEEKLRSTPISNTRFRSGIMQVCIQKQEAAQPQAITTKVTPAQPLAPVTPTPKAENKPSTPKTTTSNNIETIAQQITNPPTRALVKQFLFVISDSPNETILGTDKETIYSKFDDKKIAHLKEVLKKNVLIQIQSKPDDTSSSPITEPKGSQNDTSATTVNPSQPTTTNSESPIIEAAQNTLAARIITTDNEP